MLNVISCEHGLGTHCSLCCIIPCIPWAVHQEPHPTLKEIIRSDLRERCEKKQKKTDQCQFSMYVCRPEKWNVSFFLFFFPTVVIYRLFQWSLQKKKQKHVSFYGVCMYVRPKLTLLVIFSVYFLCTFPEPIAKCWHGLFRLGKIFQIELYFSVLKKCFQAEDEYGN